MGEWLGDLPAMVAPRCEHTCVWGGWKEKKTPRTTPHLSSAPGAPSTGQVHGPCGSHRRPLPFIFISVHSVSVLALSVYCAWFFSKTGSHRGPGYLLKSHFPSPEHSWAPRAAGSHWTWGAFAVPVLGYPARHDWDHEPAVQELSCQHTLSRPVTLVSALHSNQGFLIFCRVIGIFGGLLPRTVFSEKITYPRKFPSN